MGCTARVTKPPVKQEEPVKNTFSTPKKSAVENQQQSKQTGGSSAFQTPQRSQPTTTKSDKARRALDFSTGAQQVQETLDFMFQHHDRNQTQFNPMNPFQQMAVGFPPMTAVRPNEKELERERERERQRELEAQRQLKVSLEAELVEINSTFSEVIKIVEDARQKALQPLEERREKVKREEQALVQKLEKEIDELKKSIEEVDKNPDLQISLDEPGDWSVDTSFSLGTLRTTTSAMMEEIHLKLETLCFVELMRIITFAVDVKLDSNTAHKFLVISDDGRK
ncbi:hypothetical protein INR49_005461 [Caranx melampygus]|nr:hypothetical protein INR49_005461 [Caranx melampygus]